MTITPRHDGIRAGRVLPGLPRVLVFVCVLLAACAGCERAGKRVVYADFVDIPSEGWSRKEFCAFETAGLDSAMFADSAARYDVLLTVRHTGECPYAELLLPAVQSEDGCTALPDTLRVRLADRDGSWLGTNSKGIYTVRDTILRHAKLPPLYSLRLYHAMPAERLTGLLSVGVAIEKADESSN